MPDRKLPDLLDPENNPTLFPNDQWRAFALRHNAEERQLQRLIDLLSQGEL